MRALSAALTTLVLTASLAAVGGASAAAYPVELPDQGEVETYLVTLPDQPLATYAGGITGLAPTAPHATGADRLDPDTPASLAYLAYLETRRDAAVASIQLALGRTVDAGLHYDAVLNGFTMELTAVEASTVAGLPEVARVSPDTMLELHTDAGPAWIGAPAVWEGVGGIDATEGEGVVVGVIDTGVNFRHPSFAEVGPVDEHVHENPRGTYFGLCDPLTGAPFCNDKLIGMWDFTTGAQPTDEHGHGSHVASTAAGNLLDMSLEAPTTTLDRTISGVAPHANIISYKACLAIGSCPLTGTLGSIDQATRDQVDVINFSIGGGPANPWTSDLAIAFAGARSAGVFVATSAGNSGPGEATIGNPANAPWVFTVAASTHDRDFPNVLAELTRDGEPGPADLSGKGLTAGYGPARVVYAGDFGNALCGDGIPEASVNPFPPGTFDGEIVVCDRGEFARVDKARHVRDAGAGGFVLANDEASGDSLVADPYDLPGVHITFDDGVALKAWIAEGGGPDHQGTAVITGVTVDRSPVTGDVMAAFSSRGPNAPAPGVLKPDITVPGVDILAAWEGTTSPLDPETYNSISGTSMSSPHAAGAAALVRATQPDWTPDEVRAAMMTTAFTEPPGSGDEVHPILKEDASVPSDPFDRGAGRIDLRRASLAGLVLDETPDSYQAADPAAGGDPRTLNLPSFTDPACEDTCGWTRELRSSAETTITWTASGMAAAGVAISVEPESFTIEPGDTATLAVTADVSEVTERGWQFGQVRLVPDDGQAVPAVHLPVAVQPEDVDDPDVELLSLHFRGNLGDEFGCTGDGRTDIAACGGPFLVPDDALSSEEPARWGPVVTGVNGTAPQNIHDPNWTWVLDEPTTVRGPMTVEWWAGCALCGVLGEDWTIRLWADGERAFEQRITATPAPGQVTLLDTTVTLPEISAEETLTLHVDPVFVDTQQGTFVFYDSTQPCPAAGEGPCDSVVHMPVPRDTVDLAVTDVIPEEIPGRERRGGPRYRLIATIDNVGEADAGESHTEFWLSGNDRDDLLGLVATPAISAGEAVEVEVGLDTRGLNGDYTITVTADALQALPDGDRDDNVGRLLTTIRGNQIRDYQFEPGPA